MDALTYEEYLQTISFREQPINNIKLSVRPKDISNEVVSFELYSFKHDIHEFISINCTTFPFPYFIMESIKKTKEITYSSHHLPPPQQKVLSNIDLWMESPSLPMMERSIKRIYRVRHLGNLIFKHDNRKKKQQKANRS